MRTQACRTREPLPLEADDSTKEQGQAKSQDLLVLGDVLPQFRSQGQNPTLRLRLPHDQTR
jgi:hypothetical protein